MLHSFIAGLNVYHNFRTFLLIGFYSLLLWTGICSTIWICLRAFGIAIPYILIFPIQAVSATLVLHALLVTPVIFLGLFHAWQEGFSLTQIREMGERERALKDA